MSGLVNKFIQRYGRQISEGVFGGLVGGGIASGLAVRGGEEKDAITASGVGGVLAGTAVALGTRSLVGGVRVGRRVAAFKKSDPRFVGMSDELLSQQDRLTNLKGTLDGMSKTKYLDTQYKAMGEVKPGIASFEALGKEISAIKQRLPMMESVVRSDRSTVKELEKSLYELRKLKRSAVQAEVDLQVNTFQATSNLRNNPKSMRQVRSEARSTVEGEYGPRMSSLQEQLDRSRQMLNESLAEQARVQQSLQPLTTRHKQLTSDYSKLTDGIKDTKTTLDRLRKQQQDYLQKQTEQMKRDIYGTFFAFGG